MIQRRRGWSLTLLALLAAIISRAEASARDADRKPAVAPLVPDPFVQASPLICAVTCRDGVCVLAAHAPQHDEPLAWFHADEETSRSVHRTGDDQHNILDLPKQHNDLRIHSLPCGIAFLSAGWRTDGLLPEALECCARERQGYGSQDAERLGRVLVRDLSYHKATAAVSEQVRVVFVEFNATGFWDATVFFRKRAHSPPNQQERPLSSVSLLAVPTRDSPRRLYVLDAAGAHAVRALAVGGGVVDGAHAAKRVNDKLMTTLFDDMTEKECFPVLLQILVDQKVISSPTCVELAFVDATSSTVTRKQPSEYLSS